MTKLDENPAFRKAFMDFIRKWAPEGSKAEFVSELGEMVLLVTKEDDLDPVTRRRLADGKRALDLLGVEPRAASELDQQLDTLRQGIVALQSLDDLGSEEANKKAWKDMEALQKRYNELEKRKK